MSLQIYIGRNFYNDIQDVKYMHEVEALARIFHRTWELFGHTSEHYAMIANFREILSGREINPDLVIISERGIGLIENKNHFGKIDCSSPQGPWYFGIGEQKNRIGAGGEVNPFVQAQKYIQKIRDALLDSTPPWLSGNQAEQQEFVFPFAVCFTNLNTQIGDCRDSLQRRYRLDKSADGQIQTRELRKWQRFDVLTPAEIPRWMLSIRFEMDMGPPIHNLFHISKPQIELLVDKFFKAEPWIEMMNLVRKTPKPYGFLVRTDDGFAYQLTHDEFLIGRDSAVCSVNIPAEYGRVSKVHARIFRQKDKFFLENFSQNNGTFISGMKIEGQVEIKPGQTFVLGGRSASTLSCELRFISSKELSPLYSTIPGTKTET